VARPMPPEVPVMTTVRVSEVRSMSVSCERTRPVVPPAGAGRPDLALLRCIMADQRRRLRRSWRACRPRFGPAQEHHVRRRNKSCGDGARDACGEADRARAPHATGMRTLIPTRMFRRHAASAPRQATRPPPCIPPSAGRAFPSTREEHGMHDERDNTPILERPDAPAKTQEPPQSARGHTGGGHGISSGLQLG
jgi:hypothetical protein